APADSAVVVPTDEPVSSQNRACYTTTSTDITIGARITVRPQAFISLLPEAKVERLRAMTTPSPSPPISLSPPSTGERLARYMAPPAHSSPPPVPSSGCPTQIQTFRIASTQVLIDAVTVALPLPPLPPSLYIPPPVDRSRYKIEESSTARPTKDLGVDYGFVSTIDTKARQQGISEVGYGIRDTWVDSAEAVPKIAPMTVGEDDSPGDSMDGGRGGLCFSRGLGTLDRIESGDPSGALDPPGSCVHETRFQMQQAEIEALQETDRRRQAQMVETLRVMSDIRREMGDMQTKLLALRGQQRARQPAPDARILDHHDASGDVDSHV
ncbi:hypothetical protein Tco_0643378, partial [Tanacetum coccineum]